MDILKFVDYYSSEGFGVLGGAPMHHYAGDARIITDESGFRAVYDTEKIRIVTQEPPHIC